MSNDISEIPGASLNFRTELARQLGELVPEAIADGKVDVAKLKELLDDDYGDESERFGLFWPGKKRALRAAQEPTTATLKPMPSESKDWDTTQNVYIEGDNLEVLKILQKHYHNKIKMIYIDPPYNTGTDFIYPDNYVEGLQTYLEFTRQVDEQGNKLRSNAETEGRYHSNWLNMIYPRLKLARNLLTDDGVIFASIGDQELQNLLKLMSEIFGEANALPLFTRVTKKSSNNGSTFSPCTDYIVGFARAIDNLSPFSVPLTSDQVRSYNKVDERGAYKEIGLFQAALKHGGSRYPIEAPDGKMIITPRDLPWRWSKPKYDEALLRHQIIFKKTMQSPLLDIESGGRAEWNVYTKLYLKDREDAGLLPKNFSDDFQNNIGTRDLRDLGLPFDFPKPVSFIKFLASIINDKNAIVLDMFSGSGTAAHAIMMLNAEDGGSRRHIQIQLPEPTIEYSEARAAGFKTISQIGRKRIDLAGDKVKAELEAQLISRETPLDIGYRTYKLVDTNFPKWRVGSDVHASTLRQELLGLVKTGSGDSSSDDLLIELLLKQGYSLTEQITSINVDGLSVRSVGDSLLLAYLDTHVKPTLQQLRALAEIAPVRIVVLDDVFQGDDELKTNLLQICKSKDIELWTA
jgi:adenine-specific DNA-methyltransferase